MAAATSSITPAEIALQIKSIGERLTPLEGLLKSLERPASRAGLSPQELLARATAGGAAAVNGDGAITPLDMAHRKMFGKRVGHGRGDKSTGTFGGFLTDLAHMVDPRVPEKHRADCVKRLDGLGVQKLVQEGDTITKAALAESSGVTGGYTVPPMFLQELLRLAIEDAIMRPRCKKLPLTSRTLLVSSLDVTTTQSAGNTALLGGIQATWTAEAATRSQSQPQFRQTELTAWELAFYSVASNTLLADNAVGLDTLLTELFSLALTWYEEYAFLQGNGVGKPLGILNCPAALAVTRLVTGHLGFSDVAGMLAKIYWMLSRDNLFWVGHQSILPDLIKMNDAATSLGSGSTQSVGRPIWIPLSGGIQEAVQQPQGAMQAGSLMGFPLFLTEKLPALGTRGDLMLIDGAHYLIADRMEMEIDVSPHINFLTNQMTWRIVKRVDGQPWLNNPITLADGTQTVSPFVILN